MANNILRDKFVSIDRDANGRVTKECLAQFDAVLAAALEDARGKMLAELASSQRPPAGLPIELCVHVRLDVYG